MPEADFDLGRAALLEITSAESIGANAGSIDEGDGVTTVYYETMLSGYPGWRWTVSIAHIDGVEPSVLETELTPGEGALLSPAWIPWVDRLADYKAAQDAAGGDADGSDDDSDDDDSDDDDSDDDDDDDFASDNLHGGDVDGVDIDEDDDSDEEDDSDEADDSDCAATDDGIAESDDSDDDTDDDGPEDRRGEQFSEENDEHEKNY